MLNTTAGLNAQETFLADAVPPAPPTATPASPPISSPAAPPEPA